MISVVIPLFNKEAFIAEAIQSVLDQTYSEFELIVVDDCSTDASLDKVKSFNDDRLRLIIIEKSGVSVARNTGIKASKYNWIAFLDADDWWDTRFLEEMVTCIETYPSHKLFASGRTHVYKHENKRYENSLLPKDGEVMLMNYFKVINNYLPLINSSNAIIKKSLIGEAGSFNIAQKMHEDHDLWMRICVSHKVVFINKNLSYYRNTECDTASKIFYDPKDFCSFLNTIMIIKNCLANTAKSHFTSYSNRFVLLTYIKYYSRYTKEEEKEVYNLAKQLLTGKNLLLLKLLKNLPFKNTYPIFKFFWGYEK